MQWSQILAQNRDFWLPHLHSTPSLGCFPSEYCHAVWYGKTRMVWLPDGKTIEDNVYSFWQYVRTWHTHTAWWHRPHLHSIARQNCTTPILNFLVSFAHLIGAWGIFWCIVTFTLLRLINILTDEFRINIYDSSKENTCELKLLPKDIKC